MGAAGLCFHRTDGANLLDRDGASEGPSAAVRGFVGGSTGLRDMDSGNLGVPSIWLPPWRCRIVGPDHLTRHESYEEL